MNRCRFFLAFTSILTLILMAGCGSGSNQSDDREEGEFGYVLEGTTCTRQLGGGCVPASYRRYDGDAVGIHFVYPVDWIVIAANEQRLEIIPQERTSDEDPTRLFVWRETGEDLAYEDVKDELLESGKGTIDVYDATWEIYKGQWKGQPVQAQWVKLSVDPDNPWVNYVFFLITEPENFDTDQAVVRAAASSIVEPEAI